jgi:starch phosphorylase
MHLADLTSYLDADGKLCDLYSNPHAWSKKAVLNLAAAGKFSSDRTIAEYASDIWNVIPCPVEF